MSELRPAGRASAGPGVLLLALAAFATSAQADDCSKAPDQTSMKECAAKAYKRADAELNALYEQIVGRLKGDGDLAKTRAALLSTQRAWIAFRDAQCAFVGSGVAGGSIQPTIVASCLAELTQKRIQDFKTYLNCQEGDPSCPLPPKAQ